MALPPGAFNATMGAVYSPSQGAAVGPVGQLGQSGQVGQDYSTLWSAPNPPPGGTGAGAAGGGSAGLGSGSGDLLDSVGSILTSTMGDLKSAEAKEYTDPATGKPYAVPVPRTLGQNIGGSAHPGDWLPAVAGLVAALSGRKGRDLALGMGQGFLNQREAQTAQQNQTAQQQFQYEQQGRQAAVQNMQGLVQSLSGMGYHMMTVEMRRQALAQQLSHYGDMALNSAQQKIDAAPTYTAMRQAMTNFNGIAGKYGFTDVAYTPQDAQSAWLQRQGGKEQAAWQSETNGILGKFGMIPKDQEASVEAMRQSHIKNLMQDSSDPDVKSQVEGMFPPPSSESTLAAQRLTERQSEFSTRFGFLQSQAKQSQANFVAKLAQADSALDIKYKMLDVARQNAQTSQDRNSIEVAKATVGAVNAAIAENNKLVTAGASQYQAAIKQRGVIDGLEAKLANQQAADKELYPNQKGLSPQAQSISNELAKAKAQYKDVANVSTNDLKGQMAQLTALRKPLESFQAPTLGGGQGAGPQRGPGAAPRPQGAGAGAQGAAGGGIRPERKASFDNLTAQLTSKYGNDPDKWPQNVKAGYNAARQAASGG